MDERRVVIEADEPRQVLAREIERLHDEQGLRWTEIGARLGLPRYEIVQLLVASGYWLRRMGCETASGSGAASSPL